MADVMDTAGAAQANGAATPQQAAQAAAQAQPVQAAQPAQPAAPQQQGQAAAPSFDDMLKAGYQAEFDRRVQKAIQTAQGKFNDPRVEQLQQQLDSYIRREQVTRAGVAPEFADFVAYEVGKGLAEGGRFEDGLKAYLEAHAQFKGAQGAPGQAVAWSASMPAQNPDAATDDGVTAAFKKLNPTLKI